MLRGFRLIGLTWAPLIVLGRDRQLAVGSQRLRQPVESIALPRHGDDETRLLRIGLDLAAQPADLHVDAAVERLEAPATQGVQEYVPAKDPARPGDEDAQQRELAARQRDRLAGFALKRAAVEIEDQARETQRLCLVPRLGAVGVDRFRVPHGTLALPESLIVTPGIDSVTSPLPLRHPPVTTPVQLWLTTVTRASGHPGSWGASGSTQRLFRRLGPPALRG